MGVGKEEAGKGEAMVEGGLWGVGVGSSRFCEPCRAAGTNPPGNPQMPPRVGKTVHCGSLCMGS